MDKTDEISEFLKRAAEEHIKNTKDFGKHKSKITDEMVRVGFFLRDKNASYEDIQLFFDVQFNVKTTSSNIRKRMESFREKNKDFVEEVIIK